MGGSEEEPTLFVDEEDEEVPFSFFIFFYPTLFVDEEKEREREREREIRDEGGVPFFFHIGRK